MKSFRVAALVLTLLVPVSAQDPAEAVRSRVERALAEELARLRDSIVQTVRRELGTSSSSGSPDAALNLITEDLLRRHATYLASDELEGRQAGYEGNRKAAAYITGIMREAGLKPVGDLDDEGRPTYYQSFRIGRLETRNCLGLLEGSDPALKKEILVLGAHFDHLGSADQEGPPFQRSDRPRGDDKIWNGADDNGSGTSTVLALIKAFGDGGLRPKRSILFMTFSGEEGGLVGSRYYVNHPISPIAQHVYMLNLDMVGRNPDKALKVEGVGSAGGPRLRKVVEGAVAATGLKAVINDEVTITGGDSDHTPFRTRGVPYTFFFSGLHADYHKVTDHAEKLAYGNMVLVGRTAGRILWTLADAQESLGERRLDFGAPAPANPRRTLGVMVENLRPSEIAELGLAKGESGVRVTQVNDDSVASAAGLEVDDIIIRLDGKALSVDSEFSDLPRILNAVKAGTEVEVVVYRAKERRVLKARWDK